MPKRQQKADSRKRKGSSSELTAADSSTTAGTLDPGDAAARADALATADRIAARTAARRRALSTGGRIGIGVVGLAVVGAAVVVPNLVPLPSVSTAASGVVVTPEPTDSLSACAGSILDGSDLDSIATVAGTQLRFVPAAGVEATSTALAAPDISGDGAATSFVVPAPETDESGAITTAAAAGVQWQLVGTETLAGLAAAACVEPAAENWLVAGSTDVGRTSLLVLANPSAVPATVDLTLYGENGVVAAAGSTGIVIPAGTERVIALAGLAPNVVAPVVHVSARGGEIAATMQSSVISGLAPRGVDVSTASVVPSSSLRIPGVLLSRQAPVPSSDDAGVTSDLQPVVRIVAPGETDATVTVSVVNEDPTGTGTSLALVVPAGRVVEVPLNGLSDGAYTVSLQSDQPITGAARTASTGDNGDDYAWFPSATPVSGSFRVAATGEYSDRLHLVNPGADAQSLTVTRADGGTEVIDLPGGQATNLLLDGDTAIEVGGATGVLATVGLLSNGLIASYPVPPASPLAAPLTVYAH